MNSTLKKLIAPITLVVLSIYPAFATTGTTTSTTPAHVQYSSQIKVPAITVLGVTTQVGADVNATSGPHAIYVDVPTPYTNLFTYIHGDTITATTTYSPYTGHIMNNGSNLHTTGGTGSATTTSTATSTNNTSSNATTTASSSIIITVGGGGSSTTTTSTSSTGTITNVGGGGSSTTTTSTSSTGTVTNVGGGGGSYSSGGSYGNGGSYTSGGSYSNNSSSTPAQNMGNTTQTGGTISGVKPVGQVLGVSTSNPDTFGQGGGEGDLAMPNTGFGEMSDYIIMLLVSAIMMLTSGSYIARSVLFSVKK